MEKAEIMNLDVSEYDLDQRFNIFRDIKNNKSILKYLRERMKNLTIDIGGERKGNIFYLMNEGLLEGWCWQTTESAIVFLNDDDCIERGNLKYVVKDNIWFLSNIRIEKYWHSWISFSYENKLWVFDPCLQIIVEKEIYYYVFDITEIAGMVDAKTVREDLICRIKNNKQKNKYVSKSQSKETVIYGNDAVNSAMYKNSTSYIANINNGRIDNLIAHYYYYHKG